MADELFTLADCDNWDAGGLTGYAEPRMIATIRRLVAELKESLKNCRGCDGGSNCNPIFGRRCPRCKPARDLIAKMEAKP